MAINRIWWRIPTTNQEAYRRAGGRARLNKQRQEEAQARKERAKRLAESGCSKAVIAKELGCHLSSVYRYLDPEPGIDNFFSHTYQRKQWDKVIRRLKNATLHS